MIILGINFGHDGSAVILEDGRVRGYVLQERFSRIKQAGGLRKAQLDMLLGDAGLEARDIDFCAVTSTQEIEYLVGLCGDLDIRFESLSSHTFPSPLVDLIKREHISVDDSLHYFLKDVSGRPPDDHVAQVFKHHFPEIDEYASGRIRSVGSFELSLSPNSWQSHRTFSELSSHPLDREFLEGLRHGFHFPITVSLNGVDLPGYVVDHQMAHAASAYYVSGFEAAAIITHDGFGSGADNRAGMFCLGFGNKVLPLAPNHMVVGSLYHGSAARLGLGAVGGPGKLMGLAPYGIPRFFRREFVGNWFDMLERFGKPISQIWLPHCVSEARAQGIDVGAFGQEGAATESINADIAASTQKIFEETFLESASVLFSMLKKADLPRSSLCLSGGCALNCPTNSRLLRDGPFETVFVPPHCADDGLSIGAALHLYHNVMDGDLDASAARHNASPYLGRDWGAADIAHSVESAEGVDVTEPTSVARFTASALAENKIVAWFEGRSECGPRALGHRSLLADPTVAENWRRINRIKGREAWRPLAPMVLEEEAGNWFSGLPGTSPYMLFTGMVLSNDLPAITHVDKSARVQTVSPACGYVFDVLEMFFESTGIPVLLNTSLNGPGEPIVESPEEALHLLAAGGIDFLMMGPYAIRAAP